MKRRLSHLAAGAVLGYLVLLACPILAQTKDPFAGTWQLDVDKSKFVPPPGPASRMMTIEVKPDGSFRHVMTTPGQFGGQTEIEYTAKFDGKDYMILGTGLDTVALKRVDQNTIERTGKERGKEAETCMMKLSPDHNTLTMTIKGTYNGVNYSSTQVYHRQN
jgi:hypothetical protein